MGYTELSQLPAKEAAIWEAADAVQGSNQRQITRQYAGLSGTVRATVEQFTEEVTDRLSRWRNGTFEIIEAAQVVADSNPAIDAVSFRKQMEGAAYSGALTLRKNGVPLKVHELPRGGVWNMQVRQDDLDKWLHEIGAGYSLEYPYADTQPQTAPARTPEYQAEYLTEYNKLVQEDIDKAEKNLTEWENLRAEKVSEKVDKDKNIAALTAKIHALMATFLPNEPHATTAQQADTVPAPVGKAPARAPKPPATAPTFTMTKAAMIEQHGHEWPTIEQDMKGASRGELGAAKAGARGWDEAKAMEWARVNNKLKSMDKPAHSLTGAINSMASLTTSRKHTLEG